MFENNSLYVSSIEAFICSGESDEGVIFNKLSVFVEMSNLTVSIRLEYISRVSASVCAVGTVDGVIISTLSWISSTSSQRCSNQVLENISFCNCSSVSPAFETHEVWCWFKSERAPFSACSLVLIVLAFGVVEFKALSILDLQRFYSVYVNSRASLSFVCVDILWDL